MSNLVSHPQTSHNARSRNLTKKITTALISLATVFGAMVATPALVYANQYNQKINQLNQQNAQAAQAREGLEQQADSLAALIAGLQAKIAALEAQIQANQAQRDELDRKIAELQAEIVKNQGVLKTAVKEMYLAGDMSTMEMLASSKNLSEYVDRQQYREEVGSKIKETLDKINALKKDVETQKATIEKLLGDQQAMQGELDRERAETSRLLSLNLQQQAAYES